MAGEGAIDGRRYEPKFRNPDTVLCAGKSTDDGWKLWLAGPGLELLLDLDRAELLALDMQRTIAVLRQAGRGERGAFVIGGWRGDPV